MSVWNLQPHIGSLSNKKSPPVWLNIGLSSPIMCTVVWIIPTYFTGPTELFDFMPIFVFVWFIFRAQILKTNFVSPGCGFLVSVNEFSIITFPSVENWMFLIWPFTFVVNKHFYFVLLFWKNGNKPSLIDLNSEINGRDSYR